MTIFDAIKSKNIDELAAWLSANSYRDDSPWIAWFNDKYCKNCPAIQTFIPAFDREAECAYCELNNKCKFFPDFDDTPEDKDIIKMWLKSEENV